MVYDGRSNDFRFVVILVEVKVDCGRNCGGGW